MVRPALRRKEVDLRLVPLGFAALILIGALLLLLPWAHQPGQSLGQLDALFLSTSATFVTGLTTVNVAETFNGFVQALLLVLIQAGGLGIFTSTMLLVLASANRLSLSEDQTLHATVVPLCQAPPLDVFIYACLFVLVLELAGAVALFALILQAQPEANALQTLWESSFHSVSAFCNAGVFNSPGRISALAGLPRNSSGGLYACDRWEHRTEDADRSALFLFSAA